ncbi:hypothetical protein [Siccibacter turicensis]|uniref:hypothetical protein n=1 Tax=Siccibacter turicensis TaxID=357233 RepID=UPI003F572B3A
MKQQNDDNGSTPAIRDDTASALAEAVRNNCSTRITLLQDVQETGATEEGVSAV